MQPVYSTRSEGKKTYTAEEIDVLAARVVLSAEDEGKEVWYLLPVEAILGVKSLRLFPDRKGAKAQWEEYREGWEWMDFRDQGLGVSDQWLVGSDSWFLGWLEPHSDAKSQPRHQLDGCRRG